MSLRENRDRWLIEYYTKYSKPNLICPKCNIGSLLFNPGWQKVELNSDTKLNDDDAHFYYNPEEVVKYFTGFAICSNDKCQEPVGLIGILNQFAEDIPTDDHNKSYDAYLPKFFFPSLSIIQIGKNCPPEICTQIKKSFSHFFNDGSACANSIRTSLELIMNEQGIKRTTIDKNRRRKDISLHDRIELFGKGNKELKPFLLAAKWIGNAGSHIGEISKEALLDGYELLEHCIDELYEKKHRLEELKKKVKVINRTKKPIEGKKKP